MRSPYEDFAGVAAANNNNNNNDTAYKYQYHNNNNNYSNNNNSYYKNNNNNGAIPYHARENSLPFSYGQIGKSSTPLRKTPTPTKADSFLDFDFAAAPAVASASAVASQGSSAAAVDVDVKTIKTQPRLTSPLLVRKTLGSRSPTRSNTNTIANTYHYNYNNNNNSNNNSHRVTSPTPPRDDFEQLLRERREKVFSEYRVPPTPPQRQHYKLTSTANGGHNGHSYNGGRSNGHSKYNYDFEFNLNLRDEADDVVGGLGLLPRPHATRAHTLERSSLPTSTSTQQRYQTRNIDVGSDVVDHKTTSSYVERNYHTINDVGSAAWFDERPPMEVTYKRQQATTPTQLSAFGHNSGAVYGQNNIHIEQQQLQQQSATLTRSRRDLSPIYATTTKQRSSSSGPNTNGHAHSTPSPILRPETPAFPVTPRTPFGNQLAAQQTESIYQTATRQRLNSATQSYSTSGSGSAQEPQEVAAHLVKFARNSAKFWYKATLSREDAIALLLNAPPGTFLVRDSTTYKNAYGLVLRVAQAPPGSSGSEPQDLVRHFLIEPTQRGVRLKGCANEPVFTSLSALVYEHSINQLALPCLLRIPEADVVPALVPTTAAQQHLLTHGAATNVLWLYSCDTESLTGNEAIRKAIRQLYAQRPMPEPTEVHFKVTQQGITLTDNSRKKFFRKHYTAEVISHCAIDPDSRLWSEDKKTIFAFVARRSHSSKDNQCHVFCDLTTSQPAAAIVSFANRTLPTEKQRNYVL